MTVCSVVASCSAVGAARRFPSRRLSNLAHPSQAELLPPQGTIPQRGAKKACSCAASRSACQPAAAFSRALVLFKRKRQIEARLNQRQIELIGLHKQRMGLLQYDTAIGLSYWLARIGEALGRFAKKLYRLAKAPRRVILTQRLETELPDSLPAFSGIRSLAQLRIRGADLRRQVNRLF